MDHYDDFWFKYGGSAVYHHIAGGKFSAHSVELVGYDRNQQCWFMKTSEGAGWGEARFARVECGECRILTSGGQLALQLTLA